MNRNAKSLFILAVIVSIASLATWQITGGDAYTKFQIVEQVEKELDPDDPLADAGFYDGTTQVETVTRDGFRFGLLPTPAGLFDKHMLSVVSVASPFWLLAIVAALYSRKRRRETVPAR